MKYYANIINNKLSGRSQCEIIAGDVLQIEITQDIYNNIEKYEYKNGEIVEIENYEEKKRRELRRKEILARLEEIDAKSQRSIRAILAGKGTAEDEAFLLQLETEAEALRAELKDL